MPITLKRSVLKKGHVISLFVLISLLVAVGAYFYASSEEQTVQHNVRDRLKSIAELKVSQISGWIKERKSDAATFSQDPFIISELQKLLSSKDNIQYEKNLRKIMYLINTSSIYNNIMIANNKGKLLVELNSKQNRIDSTTKSFILKAIRNKKNISSDLYLDETQNKIMLNYIAPIYDENNKAIAALILRVDPYVYLYPLITEWPLPSKTSETLIVKRDGSCVLFLNKLIHQKNAALRLRIPLTKKEVPAVQAALGYRGIFSGKDYNGDNVLAYIKQIPNTNWIMIAKVDKSEIYAGLYIKDILIFSFTIMVIIILSLGLMWYYHYRQKNIYKNLFDKEKELREYHEEFRTILYSIGDGVITSDIYGNVKQINPIAAELTGWSENEAVGHPVEEIFNIYDEVSRIKVSNPVKKVLNTGSVVGLANHTMLISKSGQEIPIADSGAPIRNEQGSIEGVVIVFRDKTTEYKTEKRIRQNEARLRRAELASKSGNWELFLNSKIMIASVGAGKIYGLENEELSYDMIKKVPLPEYRPILDCALQNLIEKNEPYDVEFKIKTVDTGEVKDIHSVAQYDSENRIIFGIIQDITERKKAEETIQRNRLILQLLVEYAPAAIAMFDNEMKYLVCSKRFLKDYELNESDIVGKSHYEIFPEVPERWKEIHRNCLSGKIERCEEDPFPRLNGKLDWIRWEIHPWFEPEGKIGGIILFSEVITERKLAQDEIKRNREKWESLFNNSPAAIAIYEAFENGKDFIFTDFNAAAQKTDNLSRDTVIGKRLSNVFPSVERLGLLDVFRRVFYTGKTEYKNFYYKDDKVEGWRDNVVYKLKTGEIVAIYNDITDRVKAEIALRESEERFRTVYDAAPDGISISEIETGRIVEINEAYQKVFGFSRNEVIGRSSYEIGIWLNEDDRKPLIDDLEKYDIYNNKEIKFKRKDGTVIHTIVSGRVTSFNNQNYMLAVVHDITELNKISLALKESEESLRTTLYSIGDGVITTDKSGKVKRMNPVAEKLTGWKESDAKNKPIEEVFKIINEDKRNKVDSPARLVIKKGKIVGLANHTLLISKEGREIPIADSGAPIKNENGEIEGVVLVFRDQTKERTSQKILEDSEAQLKQSQRVARIGYYVFDITSGSWTSSEMLDEIFGIDKKYKHDIEGWLNLIHPEQRNELSSYFRHNLISKKEGFNKSYRILRNNDKSELWVHGVGSYELDKDGNVVKMFGTIQDISERMKTQNIIENSLKEKEILLKEIHHRVKNNFQQIISLIALQTEFIDEAQVLNIFDDLQTRLKSMSLIHELMYGTGNFAAVDIKEYIEKLTGHLIKTYSSNENIKLNLDLESHDFSLDSIIPCGLLINEIITNSIKYAFPNNSEGKINISFKKHEGEFYLKISDSGIGIKENIDFENLKTLGLRLINLLTIQLKGTLQVVRPFKGLQYIIRFKGVNSGG